MLQTSYRLQDKESYHLNNYGIKFSQSNCSPSSSVAQVLDESKLKENLNYINQLFTLNSKNINQAAPIPKEIYINMSAYKQHTLDTQESSQKLKQQQQTKQFQNCADEQNYINNQLYEKMLETSKKNLLETTQRKYKCKTPNLIDTQNQENKMKFIPFQNNYATNFQKKIDNILMSRRSNPNLTKKCVSNQNSLLNMNIIERSQRHLQMKDEKLKKLSQEKYHKEVEGCTFTPQLNWDSGRKKSLSGATQMKSSRMQQKSLVINRYPAYTQYQSPSNNQIILNINQNVQLLKNSRVGLQNVKSYQRLYNEKLIKNLLTERSQNEIY